jgi:hypothetical protein
MAGVQDILSEEFGLKAKSYDAILECEGSMTLMLPKNARDKVVEAVSQRYRSVKNILPRKISSAIGMAGSKVENYFLGDDTTGARIILYDFQGKVHPYFGLRDNVAVINDKAIRERAGGILIANGYRPMKDSDRVFSKEHGF